MNTMNTVMEFCCRDCGSHYYLFRRNRREDNGLCAKCENEIAELEEKCGEPRPIPAAVVELREIDEWKVFLQIMAGLALTGLVCGYVAGFAWLGLRALRALWRLL